MPSRPDARCLLGSLLPLAGLGPAMRRAARQAVASGDGVRERRLARAVVAELMRRGDLVPVTLEGAPALGTLYLLREGGRLLDLTAILSEPEPASSAVTTAGPAPRPAAAPGSGSPPTEREESLPRLLLAMEQAQSLAVGEPCDANPQVVVERILALLARALPNRRLGALLEGEVDPRLTTARVAPLVPGAAAPLWAAHRLPGAGLWIAGASELPPVLRRALTAGEGAPFSGAAGVPLLAPPGVGDDDRPDAGLLLVAAARPTSRGRLLRDARLLSRFVTERWRQHLEMTHLVHTDSLTGVHNRAFFEAQGELELERARRRESPFALVLADIDHFKGVNDAWGHPAGDAVLRAVARGLQGGLRRIDLVCRIGGEEFALILPDTGVPAARDVLQRLIELFRELRVPVPGAPEPLAVSLSFGGVAFPEGGTDLAELYRKADAMLYMSKRNGRERWTFWPPQDPQPLNEPVADAGRD